MITIIIAGLFLIIGCDDNPVGSDNSDFEYISINVKSDDVDYFTFATNSGTTTVAEEWDIAFQAIFWSPMPPYAPEIWDPYFTSSYEVARVDVSELSDLNSIPEVGSFTSDFTTFDEAGENSWYETDDNHIVQPLDYVYVVNTPDGKYPAFEVVDYYDDQGESGVFTINWKYLSE